MPFTDIVRDPSGRTILRDELLKFTWSLGTDVNSGFVLGDMGVLYERKALGDGLRVPLSKSAALYLEPAVKRTPGISTKSATQPQVDALNLESAARARRWMVGEPRILATLKAQVGTKGLPIP